MGWIPALIAGVNISSNTHTTCNRMNSSTVERNVWSLLFLIFHFISLVHEIWIVCWSTGVKFKVFLVYSDRSCHILYGNTVFRAVVMLCCVSALVLCFVQLLEREKQFLEAVCKFFKRRCRPLTIFEPNNELQSWLQLIVGLKNGQGSTPPFEEFTHSFQKLLFPFQ